MCLQSVINIQQQESRAVAGVLGLKFANIIHWPKLTIVGLASVPVKTLKNWRVTVLEIDVVDSRTVVWCPLLG